MIKLFILFITLAFVVACIECALDEKEMEDLENDMVISLRKFKKSKEEEEMIRSKLCARNLKAHEWEKLSLYCFDKTLATTKCQKCKEIFVRSFEYCNKKVPQTDGCNEITFNRRGACSMEAFENSREETLLAYKENKDEFIELIQKINDCYKKLIDDNKWDMLK